MKQTKYILPALAIPFLLAACSEDTVINSQPEEFLPIRVQVSVPEATTRTVLTETGGNLAWQWSENDQLAVTDANGVNKGSLKLISFDNETHTLATFDGSISSTLPNGENTLNILYTSDDPTSISGSYQCDYSEQDGAITSLKNRDVLVSSVVAKKTDDYVLIPSFIMIHCFSAGHFSLSFDGETPEISKVEVSGVNVMNSAEINLKDGSWKSSEGTITITPGASDFYITLIPANGVDMKFKAYGKDGKEYEGTLDVTFNLANAVYVRKDLGNGSYSGIEVNMNPVQPEEPAVDDTVGPVFTINGKKYKFTRGNLKYTLPSTPTGTGVWTILDEQTQFVNAGGLGTDANFTSLGTTPNEIGLFAWGATGLEDARKPWAVRFQGLEQSLTGDYWPSNGTTSTNGSTKDLWDNDYVYDWGRAYMESGRDANDNRQYITPSLDQFKELFTNSFVQGATVNGVKGLLCIPGVKTLEDAKTLINNTEGASCLSYMRSANHNSTGNTTTYKNITITDYDALKKLNDAVFFPAASKRNLSSGKVYNSDDLGWYWSAKTESTTNGYNLYFNCSGESSGGFFYNGGSNSSSMGRFNQMAVRLLVEVTE